MTESQNVEYKESWRDEYLKWVCGFANAQGGIIYIGKRDDGAVMGVPNAKRLLEDIPNKIQTTLGVVADVNLLSENGLDCLEIRVSPSSFPVSYRGEYHYRSGATKQQLTGIALSEFIMRRTGIHWEDVTVDGITVDDLDDESLRIFKREALRAKRMTADELDIPTEELLSKLHLIADGKLKRSAILLFYHDPAVVQNGSYVQIGRFGKGEHILYQDVLEGSLITTADKVVDLIFLKYLKAKITFEHDRRVETYPFAREAVREAIYNAIAHNCYMYGTPIQIRIEDEQMIISNRCILPENWTVDSLLAPHESIPYNPDIANVFYRAGYIEHWGRGVKTILDACEDLGAEPPRYELVGSGLRIFFPALKSAIVDESKAPNRHDIGVKASKGQGEPVADPRESAGQGDVDPAASPKGSPKVHDEPVDGPVDERIIRLISQTSSVTFDSLAKNLGMSRSTIKRAMKRLVETGRIKRVGSKRYGHWEVLK